MIWRKVITLLLLVWLLLAIFEEMLAHQGWKECAQLAGFASRSLAHTAMRFAYAVALGWNLIPLKGD